MSKYIVEIEEKPLCVFDKDTQTYFPRLWRVKGFNSLVFDEEGLSRLEELNSDYINEHYGELQDEAYQRGLEDAWEAAKKIFGYEIDGGIPIDKIGRVFGYSENETFCTADIIRHNTASEAIAKLKAYEDKQKDRIEVGDEVIAPCGKAVVTLIETDDLVHYLYSGGDYGCIEPQKLKKTGKHYDIASILEAMRE